MIVMFNRSDAIGDTILSLPMAKMVKDRFPESKVVFLIAEKSRDLFTHNPYVDGVLVFPEKLKFWQRVKFLRDSFRQWKIDHYFYVGGAHLPSLVAFGMGIPFRGGSKNKFCEFLFLGQGIRQRRSLVEMHEAEYNLELLAPLGIHYRVGQKDEYTPKIYLQKEEVEKARQNLQEVFKFQKIPWKEEYLVIHPGMSGHTLNWPSRNYAHFIAQLEKALPNRFSYVVSHTPADAAYLRDFREELNHAGMEFLQRKICFFEGSGLGLRNFMGLLARALLYLGPSTGPTHLAQALGTPLIGLYSPIKVQSQARWGPFFQSGSQAQAVVPEVECGQTFQCALSKCPFYECMSKIEVSRVVDLAINYLQNPIQTRDDLLKKDPGLMDQKSQKEMS